MAKSLIKSSQRVKDVGEVFTPQRIVQQMLDQPEVKEKVNNLSATFLEPSAGEGAFLVEILHRKMRVARQQSTTLEEFTDNSLIALTSLYGIELMTDNEERLVMNMIVTFLKSFRTLSTDLTGAGDSHLADSAKVIISANMAQGNALTARDGNDRPIVFSEWKLVSPPEDGKDSERKWVQRSEFLFSNNLDIAKEGSSGLFTSDPAKDKEFLHAYAPCRLTDIYKEQLEDDILPDDQKEDPSDTNTDSDPKSSSPVSANDKKNDSTKR
jgi:hypothetical protein